jgi:hypothetical protein
MERENTAAEKLVEQMLDNIEEAQAINFEKLQETDDYRTGKDVGLAEAKFQVKRAFEQVTGQEFER